MADELVCWMVSVSHASDHENLSGWKVVCRGSEDHRSGGSVRINQILSSGGCEPRIAVGMVPDGAGHVCQAEEFHRQLLQAISTQE